MKRKLAVVVLAILAAGCSPDKATKAERVKEGVPTGDDYHSTVLRSRERATRSLEKTNETRKQQVKEELEFSSKPGAPTPRAATADPTP